MKALSFVSLPLLVLGLGCTSSEGDYAAPEAAPSERPAPSPAGGKAQMAHKAPTAPAQPTPGAARAAAESSDPAETDEAEAPARPAAVAAAGPKVESAPAADDPVEAARVQNPYAFPQGGAVADAADRIGTVRLLIDGLGQKAQSHIARMNGQQPDRTGSTRIDEKGEKEAYLQDMRSTYRRMRQLMHAVARCPDATPEQPVYNRSAPIRQLADELDRYERAPARGSEATRHGDRLKPIIVNWKSVYVDPETAEQSSKPDWRVPRSFKVNWCPSP